MTTATAIDWNAWREGYEDMSFEDMQAFYEEVAERHPVQQSFAADSAETAFDLIGGKGRLHVVELGGWNGRLAAHMLERGGIGHWRNFDIVDVPQVCTHPDYSRVVLEDWFWKGPWRVGDVFVATHTIEHLSAEHLAALLRTVHTHWIYLESPLAWEPTDWTNYPGSHKLEVGWQGVEEMIVREIGYERVAATDLAGLWRRK